MSRNKMWAIKTLALVAREPGEDEAWLDEMSIEMDPKDGIIRVYGLNGKATLAFSNDGVESLQGIIASTVKTKAEAAAALNGGVLCLGRHDGIWVCRVTTIATRRHKLLRVRGNADECRSVER